MRSLSTAITARPRSCMTARWQRRSSGLAASSFGTTHSMARSRSSASSTGCKCRAGPFRMCPIPGSLIAGNNPMRQRLAPVVTEYKVIGQTTAADPGNGCMRFDTVAQGDATQLYFDQLATGNIDQSSAFTALQPGDWIDVQQKDAAAVVGAYSVVGVTNNTGWYTIDV